MSMFDGVNMLNQLSSDGLNIPIPAFASFHLRFKGQWLILTFEMEKWAFPAFQVYTPLSHMLVVHLVIVALGC